MVVGSGLLATQFMQFAGENDIVIFASGVSNSAETSLEAFSRESDLLEQYLHSNKFLVYFSTISIYDPELTNSGYIRHKLSIEKQITSHGSDYLIFRLPQLVGSTSNPNTLTNALFNAILHHQIITVYQTACRYLMDVEDVGLLLSKIIRTGSFRNNILDINFNNQIQIDNLLDIFEEVLNTKTQRQKVLKGGCYTTNNDAFISFLKAENFNYPPDYIKNVIAKYYRPLI